MKKQRPRWGKDLKRKSHSKEKGWSSVYLPLVQPTPSGLRLFGLWNSSLTVLPSFPSFSPLLLWANQIHLALCFLYAVAVPQRRRKRTSFWSLLGLPETSEPSLLAPLWLKASLLTLDVVKGKYSFYWRAKLMVIRSSRLVRSKPHDPFREQGVGWGVSWSSSAGQSGQMRLSSGQMVQAAVRLQLWMQGFWEDSGCCNQN